MRHLKWTKNKAQGHTTTKKIQEETKQEDLAIHGEHRGGRVYWNKEYYKYNGNWNKWHMAENTINEIRMKLKTINNQQNLGNQKHKTLTHDMWRSEAYSAAQRCTHTKTENILGDFRIQNYSFPLLELTLTVSHLHWCSISCMNCGFLHHCQCYWMTIWWIAERWSSNI